MELIKDGKRIDGRSLNELRPIEAKVGVLNNADGSAFFRMGKTVALAGVYGPRKVFPRHDEQAEKAILRVRYNMAPFATKDRGRPGPSRRSMEISMVTRSSLEKVIFLEEFPKTAIDLHIEILEADASTRCAGINAAALALADAGVPMRDLVSSCAAGKVEDHIILDVAGEEDTEGDLDMPIAYYPFKNEITLLQMDGLATKQELSDMVKLAVDGCMQIYEKQKEALRRKYTMGSEEAAEPAETEKGDYE
jgi:exosome complex component RRP41